MNVAVPGKAGVYHIDEVERQSNVTYDGKNTNI